MPVVESERRTTQVVDLSLRIGEVLMASGAGAADVSATMQAVAHALGEKHAEVDVTFTSLTMSAAGQDRPVVLIRTVKRRDLDYGLLTRVDHLVRRVVAHELDVVEARRRMNHLTSASRSLPRSGVTLAWGVMCASVAAYLGGGLEIISVAFIAAVLIERLQGLLSRLRLPVFYQQIAGGMVATLLAIVLDELSPRTDASLVVSASIIMLLSGIGFLGSVQDALTGFYLTGGARTLEAMFATAGTIAGVSAGLTLGRLVGADIGLLEPGLFAWASLPIVVIGGALSAAAFAVACRAPRRSWVPIALVAGAASAVYQVVAGNPRVGGQWAAGCAALVVGLVAYAVAGRIRVPPLVIAVSAVVPFLPGLSIYRGLTLLSGGDIHAVTGLLALMAAVSIAVALSAGVILGQYIAQPLRREARRVEDRLAGPRLVGVLRGRRRR